MLESKLSVVIARRTMLTPYICEFELRRADGEPLPAFRAGAHISVDTPSGSTRSYSLVNDEAETNRYVIAVKREHAGRGGSLSMHAETTVGDLLRVSAPSNAFALEDAPGYLLIAGGIGITPIMSMLRALKRRNERPFLLIYSAHNAEMTPYVEELTGSDMRKKVILHHSANAGRYFDLWSFLKVPDGRHIYYCGPPAMMDSIYSQTIHWPRSAVHSENFAGVSTVGIDSRAFRVRRAATDEVYEIPADRSVVDVFRNAGLKPKSSCESGTCGTCRVRLIQGDPDHRDLVLSESERSRYFMPCVSRAYSEEITLEM
jgi:phthalate 4,5-dioxygenase reductase component